MFANKGNVYATALTLAITIAVFIHPVFAIPAVGIIVDLYRNG